jgi:hypothetical protein
MGDRPDFLFVGAQKAATSWLHASLSRLPGVFLPAVKESHFFRQTSSDPFTWASAQRRAQVAKIMRPYKGRANLTDHDRCLIAQLEHYSKDHVDDKWYRKVFSFARGDDLCGEVCPSYFGLPIRDIERVLEISPEVRVVLVVRDPVDRCWSSIRMMMRSEGSGFRLESLLNEPERLDPILSYTDYRRAIPNWESMTQSQLRVFLFDDIVDEPGETLSQIADHIGYQETIESSPLAPAHVGDPIPIPDVFRVMLYERLRPQYEFLAALFPETVADWQRRHELEVGKAVLI